MKVHGVEIRAIGTWFPRALAHRLCLAHRMLSHRTRAILFLCFSAPALLRAQAPVYQGGLERLRTSPVPGAALAKLIDLDVDNLPLAETLREIARRAGTGLTADRRLPGLSARITFRAERIAAAAAVHRVLEGRPLQAWVSPSGRLFVVALPTPTSDVRGFVVDSIGEPVVGARLLVAGTSVHGTSNEDGLFLLPRPSDGPWTLTVMRLGYLPTRLHHTLGAVPPEGDPPPLVLSMAAAPVPLQAVVVSPGHFGAFSSTAGSNQSLTADQIRARPQLGEDVFRAINRLPGLSSSDFMAGFHSRGAEVDQLLVSFDGLQLYEPFHLKDFDGALSIIDVQSVGGVDLTTGGFTAEYGGRLGGVLAIRSAEPTADRIHTTLGLSVTSVRLQSEGGFASGRGKWLIAARRGYLDLALKLGGGADSLSPAYGDLFAKATISLGERNRVAVHLLHADDALQYTEDLGSLQSAYGSTYGWLTWDTDVSPILSGRTIASGSRLTWKKSGHANPRSPGPKSLRDERAFSAPAIRQDWSFAPSQRLAVRWGAEVQLVRTSYRYDGVHTSSGYVNGRPFSESHEVQADLAPSGTVGSAYVAPRLHPNRWLTAELGLRYDHVGYTKDALWSPRINVLAELNAKTELRLATGRYSQPQPLYALQVQDGVTRFAQADESEHRVIALDYKLGRSLTARVEVYQRITSREAPRYINLRTSGSVFPEFAPDRVLLPATRGRAGGVELSVQRVAKDGLEWSASYANARTVDVVDAQEVPRLFDQRHTGYVDASYRVPGSGWRFSIAWQVHSGWPEAPVSFTVDTIGQNTGWFVETHYGPVSALGESRLPWYHRTDLRITRDITTSHGHISAFVDVFNVFDSTNPRFVTFGGYFLENGILSVQRRSADQIGRLPSVGISWDF